MRYQPIQSLFKFNGWKSYTQHKQEPENNNYCVFPQIKN